MLLHPFKLSKSSILVVLNIHIDKSKTKVGEYYTIGWKNEKQFEEDEDGVCHSSTNHYPRWWKRLWWHSDGLFAQIDVHWFVTLEPNKTEADNGESTRILFIAFVSLVYSSSLLQQQQLFSVYSCHLPNFLTLINSLLGAVHTPLFQTAIINTTNS